MMTCNVCRRECRQNFISYLCHDGASVRLCKPCENARDAAEKLLQSKDQMMILPPDGVAAIAALAEHGGLKSFLMQQNSNRDWHGKAIAKIS